MNGYNPKYFSRSFINSFRKSIDESLSQGNKYGIGTKKSVNEQTTSGRETGVGPGKTMLQPGKTWDEIAREEAGKSVAFKGKDLTNVKYERKDGKVFADGIELTTASTKTSHYAKDAPTRAGMAPKPVAPPAAPVAPAATTRPVAAPVAPAATPKPVAPPAAPAATPKPTAAPAYTGFGSKDWDPEKNPTVVKPAAPVVAPSAPKKAPDKTATPAPVPVTPRPGPDAVRTRGPGSEVTMYRMDQTTMTDKAKEEFAKASQTPAALRLFGTKTIVPDASLPKREPQINKEQPPREASGAQLGVVGSGNQGGTITDAGRAEIEAADRRGQEIAARIRARREAEAAKTAPSLGQRFLDIFREPEKQTTPHRFSTRNLGKM